MLGIAHVDGIENVPHPMRGNFFRIVNVGRQRLMGVIDHQSIRESEKVKPSL